MTNSFRSVSAGGSPADTDLPKIPDELVDPVQLRWYLEQFQQTFAAFRMKTTEDYNSLHEQMTSSQRAAELTINALSLVIKALAPGLTPELRAEYLQVRKSSPIIALLIYIFPESIGGRGVCQAAYPP